VSTAAAYDQVLVKSAQVLNEVKGAAQYGVRAVNAGLGMNAVQQKEKIPDRGQSALRPR
jgi:hypothetical protein